METKHTPGPWTATHNTGPNMQSYSQPSGVMAGLTTLVCGCFGDIGDGEETAKANARLIAAAPELLAALANVTARLRDNAPDADGEISEWDAAYIAQAEQAIAKAVGNV